VSPNRRRSRHLLLVGVALFGLAGMLAYRSWKSSERRSTQGLPVFKELRDFSLVDQDGRKISLRDLRGKLWVANFLSLSRPGDGQRLAGRFAELDNNFKKTDRLRLVSVVIDAGLGALPELQQYRTRFEASSRWLFLTGAKSDVTTFVSDCLSGAPSKPVAAAAASPAQFVLVDGKGRVRGYYEGFGDEVVPQLLTELGSLLRAGEK
jgi:protein SCO1